MSTKSINKIFTGSLSLVMKAVVAFGIVGAFIPGVEAQISAPQNFTAVYGEYQTSTNQTNPLVKLSWTPSGGSPAGYRLYRSESLTLGCQEAHYQYDIVGGSTSEVYDWSYEEKDRLYYYSIRAVSSLSPVSGETNCSTVVSVTPQKVPPPLEPLDVTATENGYKSIYLDWEQPPKNSREIVRWRIYKTDNSDVRACDHTEGTPIYVGEEGTALSHTFYEDTEVEPGIRYYYAVRGISKSGSMSFCSTLVSPDGKRLPLPPPVMSSASEGTFEDKIEVRWTPPQPPADGSQPTSWVPPHTEADVVTNYNLHKGPGCTGEIINKPVNPDDTANVVITEAPGAYRFDHNNLVSGTEHTYSVSYSYDVSKYGNHGVVCSEPIKGYTKLKPPILHPDNPNDPNDPNANVGASDGEFDNRIVIRWKKPEDTVSVTGYRLYPKSSTCVGSYITILNDATSEYVREDSEGIISGKIYNYSIEAFSNTVGIEKSSCVTDPGHARLKPPVHQPTQGTFTDRVEVPITDPVGEDIAGYRVYLTPNCSGGYVDVPYPSPKYVHGVNNSVHGAVVPGTIYTYSVKTIPLDPDNIVESVCSEPKTGYAAIPAPIGVVASKGASDSTVTVNWTPIQHPSVQGYLVYRGPNCSGKSVPVQISSPVQNSSQALDTVNSGEVYSYSVRAIGANGIKTICSEIGASNPLNTGALPDAQGFASLKAPTMISASEGDYFDRIITQWQPNPANVGIVNYKLYRNNNCSDSAEIFPPAGLSVNYMDSDEVVVGGIKHDYSVRAISGLGYVLPSPCSNFKTGWTKLAAPTKPDATDGDFSDRVEITLTPVPGAKEYIVYRSLNCSGTVVERTSSTTANDRSVEQGKIHPYSYRVVSIDGIESDCSPSDPGHKGIGAPPLKVHPSDNPEGLVPTWIKPDGDIVGYELYRSENPAHTCQNGATLIKGDLPGTATTYLDENVEAGKEYYYSILAISSSGSKSTCSQAVSGIYKGTALLSPAFAKFNTFLGQENVAEIINEGNRSKTVTVTIFNLRGEEMHSETQLIPAKKQVDILIHDRIRAVCDRGEATCAGFEDRSATVGAPNGYAGPDGVVDTYGLVRLEFDDSDPSEKVLGRLSFYRNNKDGSHSFAFAREFRNSLNGTSFGISNTHDPRRSGFLVPNWVEVINLGSRGNDGKLQSTHEGYTVKLYNQEGKLVYTDHKFIGPLGEYDFQGGHELVDSKGKVIESVYLAEVIPDNPRAEYFLSVARYSYNAVGGFEADTYNYALVIEGQNAGNNTLYAPIGDTLSGVKGMSSKVYGENWVEVSCISNTPCEGMLRYIHQDGVTQMTEPFSMNAKAQLHFDTSVLFKNARATGSVHLIPFKGQIIGQSMTYMKTGVTELNTAFVSSARLPGGEIQSGSINTYRGIQSVLSIFSTVVNPTQTTYQVNSFSGVTMSGALNLGTQAVGSLSVNDNSSFSFPNNQYGTIILNSQNPGTIQGEVRRVRVLPNGEVDFVMPTLIK